MVILPRIARALHHPGVAAFLGLVLLAIGCYGLVSGNIPRLWSIVIIVVGAINIFRLVRQPTDNT
jgi:hypothetical protein